MRAFFFGPDLGFDLDAPSPVAESAGAALLVPFFLEPSMGGPIEGGVPSPPGVGALESDVLSTFCSGAAGAVTDTDVDGEGSGSLMSLFWGSSLAISEGIISRNFDGETVSVINRLGLPPDLRRPSAAALDDGAIALEPYVSRCGE